MSRPPPQIPARFSRAARRDAVLKWLVRIAVILMLVVFVAAGVFVFMLPGIARKRARERLEAAGLDPSFSISQLSHERLVLNDLKFGAGIGNLRVAEMEISFSLAGLRDGWVKEVRLRGMSGTAGKVGAKWTFGGLEHLAALARAGEVGGMSTGHSLMAESFVVDDGVFEVGLPGIPAMTVPFELTAQSPDRSEVYEFTAKLSPGQQPLEVSGEFNPISGGGRMTANAKALELAGWMQYLLLQEGLPYSLTHLSAKTDVQISALFEHFSLSWAHFDGEFAGVDVLLERQAATEKQAQRGTGEPAKSIQATAHNCRIMADFLPAEGGGKRRFEGTVQTGRFRIADRDTGSITDTSDLEFGCSANWEPRGRPVYTAECKIKDLHHKTNGAGIACDELVLGTSEFMSLDALRWQGNAGSVEGSWSETRLAVASVPLRGSLRDFEATLEEASLDVHELRGKLDVVISVPGPEGVGVSGRGTLNSLEDQGIAGIKAPTAFTFTGSLGDGFKFDVPDLETPVLGNARINGLHLEVAATKAGDYALAGKGALTLTPDIIAEAINVDIKDGTNCQAKFTAECRWKGSRPEMTARLTFPSQKLSLEGSDWRGTGTVKGRAELETGSSQELRLNMQLRDISLTAGMQGLTCRQLDAESILVTTAERNRLLGHSTANRFSDLSITGHFKAIGLSAHSGMLKVTGASVSLPVAWKPDRGFGKVAGKDNQPKVTAEEIELGPVRLVPGDISLALKGRDLQLATGFRDIEDSLQGNASAALTLSRDSAVLLRVKAECSDLANATWLADCFPGGLLKDVDMGGTVSLSGSLFVDPVSAAGTGKIELQDVRLSNDLDNYSFEGINCKVEFNELFPPGTSPGQRLAVDKGRIGGFAFGPAGFTFQIRKGAGVFVERAATSWCQGMLKTHAVSLDPKRNEMILDLYAEDIQLGHLLSAQGILRGAALGTVEGHLPIRIKDGKATFERLSIYSSPGSGGRLQLRRPDRLLRILGVEPPYQKDVLRTLADMMYSSWELSLSATPTPRLAFRLDGYRSDDRRAKPLRLARTRELPSQDLLEVIRFIASQAESSPTED